MNLSIMYEKITNDIRIEVEPAFNAEQSAPDESRYVWAYRIKIRNQSEGPVRLLTRYWRITNAHGMIQEVSGEGVVGEQPLIAPGKQYEYSSGAPLTTPSGFMTGNYTMAHEDGRQFTVDIPLFSLDSPHQDVILN